MRLFYFLVPVLAIDDLPIALEPVCTQWGIKIANTTNDYLDLLEKISPCDVDATIESAPTKCCREWLIWRKELTSLSNYFSKHELSYAQTICDSWGVRESGAFLVYKFSNHNISWILKYLGILKIIFMEYKGRGKILRVHQQHSWPLGSVYWQ